MTKPGQRITAGDLRLLEGSNRPTIQDYLFAWGIDPSDAKGIVTSIWVGHLFRARAPITKDPWPFTIDNCGYAGYFQGHWTRDNTQLFCPGCGADCT